MSLAGFAGLGFAGNRRDKAATISAISRFSIHCGQVRRRRGAGHCQKRLKDAFETPADDLQTQRE
jgi:hypothetical protein